jgi:hypothetical protein
VAAPAVPLLEDVAHGRLRVPEQVSCMRVVQGHESFEKNGIPTRIGCGKFPSKLMLREAKYCSGSNENGSWPPCSVKEGPRSLDDLKWQTRDI